METLNDERKYQGWATYETWLVSLWLDNEEPSYRYWREQVERCRRQAFETPWVREGNWTEEEAARFNLADQLKDEVTDGSPLQDPSMYSDLLSAALGEVDWQEIAEHWLAE